MSIDPWGDFVSVWAPKARVDFDTALAGVVSRTQSPALLSEYARFSNAVAFGSTAPARVLVTVPDFYVTFVSDDLKEDRGWVMDFSVDLPSAFPP